MTTIMKLIKGLAYAAVALLTLASCNEKYDEWNPGEADTGSQFYFSNTTATTVTLTPASTSIDIPLYRVDTSSSSAAVVSVSEEETALVIASSPATFNVSFDAGSNVANLSIPVDMSKIDFGKSAKLNLTITGETTQYAASTLSVTATLPEPWKSLGKDGKFYDGFFMGEPLEGIEIQQNELYPEQFRLVNPYKKAPSVDGLSKPGNASEFVNFKILKPGDTVFDETVTQNDLVFFSAYYTGYYHDNYADDIKVYHPAYFTATGTEASWLHNKVLSYQDNGLPAQVQFGPRYYMDNVGGWNYSQNDDMIVITFPGVVLKDYTIGLTVEGILTDSEGTDNALVSVDFIGANAEKAAVVLVKGGDEDAIDYALDLVFVEDESVVIIDKPGMVKLPFAADAEGGKYTVVAVPISDKGQQDDYAVYATVQYGLGPFEIAYTEDDLLAGVPKATLLGTNWIMWATDDEGAATDREPYSIVTFEDADDKIIGGDECDIVKVSGIDYGVGQKAGFDGTLEMEWYSGAIYMIGNPSAGEVVLSGTTYTIKPVVMDYTALIYSTGNYGMCAAYVADGLVAFVSNSSYDYTGIEFAAFDSEGTYQGYFACANYIILADPAVYPLNYSAPAAVQKAKETLVKLQAKKYQMYKGDSPRNYVELPMGPVQQGVRKAPVVASGKAHASKELGDAQSQRANL